MKYKIESCSSESSKYPCRNLEISNNKVEDHNVPTSQIYLSAKFAEYPVSIIISFDSPSSIDKLHLLSHQYLIASKVEIHVSNDFSLKNNKSISFTKLGFVKFDENPDMKKRELKSIKIFKPNIKFIRLIFHQNYVNIKNKYNQFGIVKLSIDGANDTVPTMYVDNNEPRKTRKSIDTGISQENLKIIGDLQKALDSCEAKKSAFLELSNYPKVKLIASTISAITIAKSTVDILIRKLSVCLSNEDYDMATAVQSEIVKLSIAALNDVDRMDEKLIAERTTDITETDEVIVQSDNSTVVEAKSIFCPFCAIRLPTKRSANLDDHLLNECVKLRVCDRCHQVVEKCLYEEHIANSRECYG